MLVLDSGAVTFFANQTRQSDALLKRLVAVEGRPLVPSVVLVECLQGSDRDAKTNRFLKTCSVRTFISGPEARRAGRIRRFAGHGSAVDAVVVVVAEDGIVVTSDSEDIRALAMYGLNVGVVVI